MVTTAIILFHLFIKKYIYICSLVTFHLQDLTKLPDSTSNVAGYMEPVKTFGSSHEEQRVDKPVEQ